MHEISEPDALLARLSRDTPAVTRAGLNATCFIARVDAKERLVTYSSAGSPPGTLTGPRGVRALSAGGPPLGLFDRARYDVETVSFGEGDVMTLVSDGISTALGVSGELLPCAVAAEVSSAPAATPESICAKLLAATRGTRGASNERPGTDDRTVVAFGLVASARAHASRHSFSSIPNRSAIR